ncbi:MAG: DUF72 domain-containing protein [Promethearchaeota archaeon]
MIRLGTAGWKYEDWLGSFYPSKRHQFLYYHKIFDTTEINSTFYSYPRAKAVEAWARAPEGFVFTAKVPKDITHKLRLDVNEGADQRLQDFLKLMLPLRESRHLGPLLLQMPPSYDFNLEGLESFLDILPDEWQFAIEFRHTSWMQDETFQLLRRHKVAYCIVDEPLLPPRVEVTAPFSYIRWHGHGEKLWYWYLYNNEELEKWVPRVQEAKAKCEQPVYGYFNNHWHGFAARNCVEMMELLGLRHNMPGHVRDRLERVTDQRIKRKPTKQVGLSDFIED